MDQPKYKSVYVPSYLYVLASHNPPTAEQAEHLRGTEWGGGRLDGLPVQMPNVVDWERSEIDISPLIPWLGNPDDRYATQLAKQWPGLEVIKLEVVAIGGPYQWGDLVAFKTI